MPSSGSLPTSTPTTSSPSTAGWPMRSAASPQSLAATRMTASASTTGANVSPWDAAVGAWRRVKSTRSVVREEGGGRREAGRDFPSPSPTFAHSSRLPPPSVHEDDVGAHRRLLVAQRGPLGEDRLIRFVVAHFPSQHDVIGELVCWCERAFRQRRFCVS